MFKSISIYSRSDDEFLKNYTFNEYGLNIIIGERSDPNDETNAVGKSTFINILRYLLGEQLDSKYYRCDEIVKRQIIIFANISIKNVNFRAAIPLYTNEDKVYILKDVYDESVKIDDPNWTILSNNEYKKFIEDLFLGDHQKEKTPSFASIREYIVRDEKVGFGEIMLHNRNAITNHRILNFLFGLPNYYELEIEKLKKAIQACNEKINLSKTISETKTSLTTKRSKKNRELQTLQDQIKKLDLQKHYNIDEEKYNSLKSKLQDLSNQLFKLERVKAQYNKNIDNLELKLNEIQGFNDLELFFSELDVVMPTAIKKSKEDIEQFYTYMIDSRGKYFKSIINEIESKMSDLKQEKNNLQKDLDSIMKLLVSTNVVNDLKAINDKVAQTSKELADIDYKLNVLLEGKELISEVNRLKNNIIIETEKYYKEFESYQKRKNLINEMFNKLVDVAYKEDGDLEFEFDNSTDLKSTTGRIKISCSINEEESLGRSIVKVILFDLTWLIFNVENNGPINILIHDGAYVIPDKNITKKILHFMVDFFNQHKNGQYIVTLNIDDLDVETKETFEKHNYLIATLRKSNDENRFMGFKYAVNKRKFKKI